MAVTCGGICACASVNWAVMRSRKGDRSVSSVYRKEERK